MTAIEKFTFSLSFDDADNVIRSAGGEDEHYELGKKKKKKKEDEAPPPPPPVYTEEQGTQMVADAEKRGHEQGFAEGHKQGFDEAHQQIMASLEKAVGDVESEIAEKLAQIDEQQKRANAKINEDAIHVALGVIRKLAPAWSKQYQLTEIEDIVRQCLANLFDVPKVMIKVHPELEKDVGAATERIAVSRGFSGKIVVVGEPDVAMGDCQVSWGDGTAVRDSSRIWSEINEIIDNALALHASDHGLTESDMGDPEVQESRIPKDDPASSTLADEGADAGTVPTDPTEIPNKSDMDREATPNSPQPTEAPKPASHQTSGSEPPESLRSPDANPAEPAQGSPTEAVKHVTPDMSSPAGPAAHRAAPQEGDGTDARNMQTSQDDTMANPAPAGDTAQRPETITEGQADDKPDTQNNHTTATAQNPAKPVNAGPENGQPRTQENPTTTAGETAAVKQPTKDAGDENG
ncbi:MULTISPECIES: FliH/SctL family protein [unclassified Thalassospira]|uniref:FliH/SctL family protein n=1 Tax=unclassified Thalassospira TaxID=2648997 RepID=UPI0025CD6062|nr:MULTISPECIES: FliH/SctL family protein [unclassified Thalassospira]|tara:strand:- start:1298 stop:2686 length:1389 start_codon:yes stop_codon:yes gene_type:complete